MIKSIFAEKDATIYSNNTNLNSGLDSILELTKSRYNFYGEYTNNPSESLSRILIKFNLNEISSSIASGKITSPKYYLKLNTSTATRLQSDYELMVYPISGSWSMGLGEKNSNPVITSGVTWNYRASGSAWNTSSILDIHQGGSWYSAISGSQRFTYELSDATIDVTSIVNAWIGNTLPNDGFIIKYSSSLENDNTEYGTISFFSRDTHTIYPPLLQVKWDDSIFITGSLSSVDTNSMTISLSGLKDCYRSDEISKINLLVRDNYPQKTFITSSRYLIHKYLPSSSYYSVKDAYTDEILIPFDSASTKLSCNGTGSYFNFDMSGLQPKRYYKFVLKIENAMDTTIIDDKFYFKVER